MTKPTPYLKTHVQLLKKGRVLDLGSGDGRNIAFLRENGFEVKGIEKNYGDMIEDVIRTSDTHWDTIMSIYTIHFLPPEVAQETYAWMKQHTVSGGVNMLIDFIDEGEWDLSESHGFYLKKGELREMYADWEILNYEEKDVQTYKGSRQKAAFLVAKKL